MTENCRKYNVCSTVTDIYTVHILEGFCRYDEMATYKMFLR